MDTTLQNRVIERRNFAVRPEDDSPIVTAIQTVRQFVTDCPKAHVEGPCVECHETTEAVMLFGGKAGFLCVPCQQKIRAGLHAMCEQVMYDVE
jgi:hypothetical protein